MKFIENNSRVFFGPDYSSWAGGEDVSDFSCYIYLDSDKDVNVLKRGRLLKPVSAWLGQNIGERGQEYKFCRSRKSKVLQNGGLLTKQPSAWRLYFRTEADALAFKMVWA